VKNRDPYCTPLCSPHGRANTRITYNSSRCRLSAVVRCAAQPGEIARISQYSNMLSSSVLSAIFVWFIFLSTAVDHPEFEASLIKVNAKVIADRP
jgi:hypothetical protein